jgi:hypothetical protein
MTCRQSRAWLVTVRQKAGHELREFLLLAAYLYVCFSALVLYKMAILDAQGISFSPFGLPIVKALLLAKFIMLGHAVRLGTGHAGSSTSFFTRRYSTWRC